ncbi:MAG: type II toxin-antitoxin system HicA family toxin [Cyanobacteriota bacterium]|nr:type II toxin-antitoxin system HicA family toxin [Cyanobacteriota bacterium]
MAGKRKIIPISYKILVKVFELKGFTVKRQKGDHLILTKPEVKRPVVIKTSPGEVPVTHILTNIRTAGISREEYFQLLDKVQ